MRPYPRIAVFLVAATTALTLGVPGAAVAEDRPSRLGLGDSAGDVWRLSEDAEPPATEMPAADVVGASIVHGRHRLKVTTTFLDLQQVDAQDYSVNVFTPERRMWNFIVLADEDNWAGRLLAYRYSDRGGEREVSCAGATHQVDYAAESVSLVVPRGCIGRPDWVRMSIYNTLEHDPIDGPAVRYWDNPHNSNVMDGGVTGRIARAPEPGDTASAPYRKELTDPTGDVGTQGPDAVLAPGTPAADVVRAVLAHKARRFVIRQELVDLTPDGRQGYGAWLLTDEGSRHAWLDVSPRHPDGVLRIIRGSGRRVVCEAATFAVDHENDVIRMSIPRGCLGRPDWVRALLTNYLIRSDSEGRVSYTDNPHNDQPYPDRPTRRLYHPVH